MQLQVGSNDIVGVKPTLQSSDSRQIKFCIL